ncbi:MAG: hypothetical protein R6U44_12585 [Archaeoglobaceae archaeon]
MSWLELVVNVTELLNQNSGAIQALTTVLLVIVTIAYVYLTKKGLDESRREKQAPKMEELINEILVRLKTSAEANVKDLPRKKYRYDFRKKVINVNRILPSREDILFRDFKEEYPELYKKMQEHDRICRDLEKEVVKLADKILDIPGFKDRCYKMIEEYNASVELEDKLTDQQLKDFPPILLRDIIDKNEEFRERELFRGFWDMHRVELIGYLDKEEVKEEVKEVKKLTDKLLKKAKKIYEELDKEILELSRKYRIKVDKVEDFVVN